MNNTPQPEESPDEILASEIAWLEQGIKRCKEHKYPVLFKDKCKKYEKDLAMLEAHQAQRKLIKDYMPCTCAINYGVSSGTCPKCVTIRQSDDAIRGMRG